MNRPFEGRSDEDLEGLEDAHLEPYGVRSRGAARRYALRDTGRTLAYRTPFQRDRDRILHSLAFRRLKHKTQVYVPYEGDHHRTRLTHTLEVAQVARTVARALGLNEDLAEAISLGHDLGQPPFGRGGQEVLQDLLSGDQAIEGIDPGTLAATGGFRPNYQGLRVVDRLEQRYDHPGLNLTDPVREGIWKCGPVEPALDYPDWQAEGLAPDRPAFLEAQVVATADRIARLAHDLEDGMRCREVDLEAVERLAVGRAVLQKVGGSYPRSGHRLRRQNAMTRGILHLLVSDVVVGTASRLHDGDDEAPDPRPAKTSADSSGEAATGPAIPGLPADTVRFSSAVRDMVDELDGFVEAQVYRSFAVSRLDARARTFIVGLISAYYRDPLQLDDYALFRFRGLVGDPYLRDVPGNRVEEEIAERYHGNPTFVRLLADHVAGMSDTYALKEYERLYLPFPEAEGR